MENKNNNVDRGNLKQNLSEKFVWAIAYGSCIGWGAFILPGDWIKQSGPIASSIGIVIGALLMILIAVSYGALVEKFPVSGGAFAFSFLSFGRYVSFFSSWFLTFGYVCVVALNATAFSLLIKFLLPNVLNNGKLYTVAGWDVYITEIVIATVLLIVFMLITIRGASVSGSLQYYFCVAMVLVVALMFIGSFFSSHFSLSHLEPLASVDKGWFQSIIMIVSIAPWAYVGFDNIPQTAEEFNFSPNKTFKLIVYSLLAASLTYVVMLLYTGWLGTQATSLNGNLWLTGAVTQDAFGFIGLAVLAVAIIMGIFTGLNGFLMSSSRLLFSMGRSGIMPTVFSKLHSKHKTPYVNKQSNTYAPVYKIFGIIGSIVSFVFLCLLLIPGSPAALSIPSYIALGIWLVIGLIFFIIRLPKLKKMNNDEMSRLILNHSEDEVLEMIHEPGQSNSTNK